MDYPELHLYKERLHQQTLSEALQNNEEQTRIWTQYINQHKKVLEGLKIIPLEMTINCMVPIGKQALMAGKLKHTNEILVCIGEGYFINYTAAQAIELCDRRIKRAEKILSDLEEERNLFESRQIVPLSFGAFGENLNDVIIEHCNNEDLEKWRVEHSEREKKYREQVAQQKTERNNIETEEDIVRRLDELELQEELADEYFRLHGYEDDDDSDEEEDDCEELEDKEEEEEEVDEIFSEYKETVLNEAALNVSEKDITKPLEEQMVEKCLSSEISLSSPFSEEASDNHHVIGTKENLNEENSLNKLEPQNKDQLVKDRRVSFADPSDVDSSDADESTTYSDSEQNSHFVLNSQTIHFEHSTIIPKVIDECNTLVNTPGDIYNTFYKPKSILKRSQNDLYVREITSLPKESTFNKDSKSETVEAAEAVVKMQEKTIEPLNKIKPVSRFRLERASLNK